MAGELSRYASARRADNAHVLNLHGGVRPRRPLRTAPGCGQKPMRDLDNERSYRTAAAPRAMDAQVSRRRTLLDLVEHFWSRVDRTGDCWLWTGEVNNKGYGIYPIYERGQREKLLAHRFSALMAGMPVRTPKDVVMHTCDTPLCVRPEHLSVGTQSDNMRDAQAKNRMNLDGLTAAILQACKDCGREFIGLPNRRYCETHKFSNRWSQ